jgi:P-type Cu+ transporter
MYLSVNPVILSMSELIPYVNDFIKNLISMKICLIIQFALSLTVVIFTSGFLFIKGITSIIKWKLNMFTLITIDTGVARIYSVIVIFSPDILPASF